MDVIEKEQITKAKILGYLNDVIWNNIFLNLEKKKNIQKYSETDIDIRARYNDKKTNTGC